jgi:hypothetical protein
MSKITEFDLQLFAEGDDAGAGGAGGDGGDGQKPPEGQKPAEGQKPPETKSEEKFDKEYVDKLRRENAESKKNAKDLADKLAKIDEDRLKEEGKWKELAEKALKDKMDTESATDAKIRAFNDRLANAELRRLASEKGIIDPDLLSLADRTGLSVNDDGDVVGAEAVINKLIETKPHLFDKKKSGRGNGNGAPATPPKKGADTEDHSTDFMKAKQSDVDREWAKLGTGDGNRVFRPENYN